MKSLYYTSYDHRFEIYLAAELIILFGTLIFPLRIFDEILLPLLFSLNILAGTLIISRHRKIFRFLIFLFILSLILFGSAVVTENLKDKTINLLILVVFATFHLFVTWHIIIQVLREREVDRQVIFGVICGYISLGFLGFTIVLAIISGNPHAYAGISLDGPGVLFHHDSLLYYSFMTLMTVGYGDIIPTTPAAQKSAILIGLMGQFYLVIITAVVVGKYVSHSTKKR